MRIVRVTRSYSALLCLLSCVLLTCFSLEAQQAARDAAAAPAVDATKIEGLAREILAQQHVPGMSLAVVLNGQVVFSHAYGLADIEDGVPATPATKFRTASIAKPMTAIAAMELVREGKLELDAPVQKYCPAFPLKVSPTGKEWPVTARELLSHRAGVRWYSNDAEAKNAKHFNELNLAITVFGNDPLLFEPGTDFRYSSYGYVVVGCALEGASHQKYTDFVRQAVFIPAGMTATVADNPRDIIPHRAHGYEKGKTGQLENAPCFDPSDRLPGGGWLSTSEDLVRFAAAVMAGKLIDQGTLEQMWKSLSTQMDGSTYGLGWGISKPGEYRVVGHSGGQDGTSTILLLVPEKHLAVAAMANLEGANLETMAREILKMYAGAR